MAKKEGRGISWGLRPFSFSRARQWQVPPPSEFDWVEKGLTGEESEFLNRFNLEFHGGGPVKGDVESLHSTDSHRKDCYSRTNSSNRCIMSIGQRLNTSVDSDPDPMVEKIIDRVLVDTESVIIEIIDGLCRKRREDSGQ